MPQSKYRGLEITSGGSGQRYYRLQEVLKIISQEGPFLDDIVKKTSRGPRKSSTSFNRLESLGLIDYNQDGKEIRITSLGEKVLNSEQAPLRLVKSFCETFIAFYDTMAILSILPIMPGQVRGILNKTYGFDWESNSGVRQRVDWLTCLNLADRNQANEYYLTEKGETYLDEIWEEFGPPEASEAIGLRKFTDGRQGEKQSDTPQDEGIHGSDQSIQDTEDNEGRQINALTANDWVDTDSLIKDSSIPSESEDLFFPTTDERSVFKRIDDAIRSNMHVILTGPPGAGKTALAEHICQHYMEDDFEVTTATADWSTFDTVGGYRPDADGELNFKPGIFLKRFLDPSILEQRHEWLVIDELNRADIGKAFGSLFSALTGRTITLPFEAANQQQVKLYGNTEDLTNPKVKSHTYYIPSDWRLLATINTVDKSSLYQMGYAFMRRFAFISVPVPSYEDLQSEEGPNTELVEGYIECWDDITIPEKGHEVWPDDCTDTDVNTPADQIAKDIGILWETLLDDSGYQTNIKVGPGLIEDILRHTLTTLHSSGELDYGPGFAAKILPQLDGIPLQNVEALIDEIHGRIETSSAGMSKFSKEIPIRTAHQLLSNV